MFCSHLPEPGKGGVFEYVACATGCFCISLSFKSKHRVWAGLYTASDPPGEMNAQEREARVGYGIDQSMNVMMLFRHDVIVFAAKWHDCEIQLGLCETAHA